MLYNLATSKTTRNLACYTCPSLGPASSFGASASSLCPPRRGVRLNNEHMHDKRTEGHYLGGRITKGATHTQTYRRTKIIYLFRTAMALAVFSSVQYSPHIKGNLRCTEVRYKKIPEYHILKAILYYIESQ